MSQEPEFVDPDDLKVDRDGSGELVSTVTTAGTLGKVELVPMTYGDIQEHFGDGTSADIESSEMAEMFNKFYVRPDFDLTADDVKDFKPLAPRDLLMTLMEESGIDAEVEVDEQGEASVEVEGNPT